MRRLAIGDIHGNYKGMMQVLDRAGFDRDKDMLIGIGDYVDGLPDTFKVLEYLSFLPNFTGVIGNHDKWAYDWLYTGERRKQISLWINQGGQATVNSYMHLDGEPNQKQVMKSHAEFLGKLGAHLVIDDMLFMHGGCFSTNFLKDVAIFGDFDLMWDRQLYVDVATAKHKAENIDLSPFKKVFVGHTQTTRAMNDFEVFSYQGFWNIDQGAGWNGKLTVVDIDTDEVWQSDIVMDVYGFANGR